MTTYTSTARLGTYLAFDITGDMNVNENGQGQSLKKLVDEALKSAPTTLGTDFGIESATKTTRVFWKGVGIDVRLTTLIMCGTTLLEAGIS